MSQTSMLTPLALVIFGYFLGWLHVPFSWLMLLLVVIYYLYSKFFISEMRLPFHDHRQQKSRTQRNRQFLPNTLLAPLVPVPQGDISEDPTKQNRANQTNGITCVNAIIGTLWKGVDSQDILDKVNTFLSTTIPQMKVLESIRITSMDLANDEPPTIVALQCVQYTEDKTIIDATFEYASGFFVEWVMRPVMIPFNLRCMISDVQVLGKLRLSIEYNPMEKGGGIAQIDVALAEYPEIQCNMQMFDSLDFNALSTTFGSMTANLRGRFRAAVMEYVYPNTYPLLAKNDSGKSGDKKKSITVGFGADLEDLEDDLKTTLTGIDDLLTNKDKQTDSGKKEVCESVMQFLKASKDPGRIPVHMMETVKRGFYVLNNFIFDEKTGHVNEPGFQVIVQKENMQFIGHVCRLCSLADDLVRNIMKIKDEKLQKQVNKVLHELKLQDIPLIVHSRSQ